MATYYVKVGGNDSADGLSDTNAWGTLTKLNATTFSAGDIIKLRCGDAWTGIWTILGNGVSGNPVTITNYGSGALPIIDANSANARAIFGNTKHYWVIDGVHVKGGTTANIQFATSANPQIKNCVSTGGVIGIYIHSGSAPVITGNTINQSATGAAISILAAVTGAVSITNNVFNGTVGANTLNGIDIRGGAVTFTGNTVTGWVGPDQTKRVFYFDGLIGLIANNNTVSNSIGMAFFLTGCISPSLSGNTVINSGYYGVYASTGSALTLSNTTITSPGANGVFLNSVGGNNIISNLTVAGCVTGDAVLLTSSNATIADLTVTGTVVGQGLQIDGNSIVTIEKFQIIENVASDAVWIDGTATVNLYYGIMSENGGDGLSANGSAIVNCWFLFSNKNGTAGGAANGDGFTAHSSSTLNLFSCVGAKNVKSGVTAVQGASGKIYNCVFYDNYDDTVAVDNYGISIDTTLAATWEIKNTITKNHRIEIQITAAALLAGLTITSDYNCFTNSRGENAYSYNGTTSNFNDYKTASGLDAYSLNTDPLFVDEDNDKFDLRYTSPCKAQALKLEADYKMGLDSSSVWPSTVGTVDRNLFQWDIGAYVIKRIIKSKFIKKTSLRNIV